MDSGENETQNFQRRPRRRQTLIFDNVHDEKIFIKDEELVQSKIDEYKKNPQNTVVVTDFDYTLTRRQNLSENAKRAFFSTFCALENSSDVSQEYKDEKDRLFREYHNYEDDLTVDFSIRDQKMREWIEMLLAETSRLNLNHDKLEKIITETKDIKLRYGIIDLFEYIYEHKIRVYIISGGLYDVINEVFFQTIPIYHKIKEEKLITIISNELLFREDGTSYDYKKPIVYTFNKSSIFKESFKENKDVNIILMGDHLYDTDIIKECEYKDCLKIGYFNKDPVKYQDFFKEYEKKFEVVINDGNLEYTNKIVREIFK